MMPSHDVAAYLFHQGTNYRSFEYMGVHCSEEIATFRVWAPNAEAVWVIGDFNAWSDEHPMARVSDGGVWESVISDGSVRFGQRYKYKIQSRGRFLYKADPYGRETCLPPETVSVIGDIDRYSWRDEGWLCYRKKAGREFYERPMNIYELHLGSWRRHADGSYYSYGELATELAPYVKQMGYTHVELMPVMEHPFDGSWGYQICSYYAPTARFGSPTDFMALIDSLHEAGIGVILDWVPAHFPKDEHGLYEFDGTPLYEYQGWDRMEHSGWGTRRFDVGRTEVQSFLISNAMFWIEKYHADGLRVDAVASMLYLDYDKNPGEWVPNSLGTNQCLEAIAFFKKLNSCIKCYHPDVITIAEESTAWPHVTGEDADSLGFDMKWNMGWMNDTLAYLPVDPIFRKHHHRSLTFSMTYAFSERFVLPFSHDEVVYGKKPLIYKIHGDEWQRFAMLRALYGYMMTHPGKKLSFMGNEIGQTREWNHDGQIAWELLEYAPHATLQHFISELNHFYLENPCLWSIDGSWEGFEWIDPNDQDRSILSYRRKDGKGKEILALINLTPVPYEDFSLQVPTAGGYRERLNSDDLPFGGSGVTNGSSVMYAEYDENTSSYRIRLRVPPLGVTLLSLCEPDEIQ